MPTPAFAGACFVAMTISCQPAGYSRGLPVAAQFDRPL
jgi:hypothetical protein